MAIDVTITTTTLTAATGTAAVRPPESTKSTPATSTPATSTPGTSTPGTGTPGIGTAERSRAYLRQMKAVHDAVAALTAKLDFKSVEAARDYAASTERGLLAALHQGKRADLTSLLQDLPNEALAAASKSLAASEARDADSDRLLQTLGDYLSAAKSRNAARSRTRFTV